MLSNVRCPECQHKFWIQEGEMGSRQTCPACQAQFFAGASVAEARAKVGAPNAAPPAGYNKTMIGESAPAIKYNCPRCKTPLEGEPGTKKNCPSCTQRHQVPAASKPEPVAASAGLNKTMLTGNESAAAPPRPPIKYNCPNCNRPLEAPAEQGGTKTNCPACSQRLQIPAAPPVAAGINKTRLASDGSAAPASAPQPAYPAAGGLVSLPAAVAPAPPASPGAGFLTPTNILLSIVILLILLLVVPAVMRGGKSDEVDRAALAKKELDLEKMRMENDRIKQDMDRQAKAEAEQRRQFEEMMRNSRAQEDRWREESRQRLLSIEDKEKRAAVEKELAQEKRRREDDKLAMERQQREMLDKTQQQLEASRRALEASQQKTTVIQQAPPPTVIYQPYQPRYYWPWRFGW